MSMPSLFVVALCIAVPGSSSGAAVSWPWDDFFGSSTKEQEAPIEPLTENQEFLQKKVSGDHETETEEITKKDGQGTHVPAAKAGGGVVNIKLDSELQVASSVKALKVNEKRSNDVEEMVARDRKQDMPISPDSGKHDVAAESEQRHINSHKVFSKALRA